MLDNNIDQLPEKSLDQTNLSSIHILHTSAVLWFSNFRPIKFSPNPREKREEEEKEFLIIFLNKQKDFS